jgi:lantibiotic modifying enzyme
MDDASALFLDTAAAIGARLCRDAYWAGDRCTWIGASMEPQDGTWSVVYRTLGADLYGGTSGVALFLARLFAATDERPLRTAAEGALRQAVALEPRIPASARPSFWSGAAGVGYAFVAAGEALDREDLVADGAARLQAACAAPLPPDVEVDVIGGVAGAIPALLSVHRRRPADALVDAAVRFGDVALARANRGPHGASWGGAAAPNAPDLTGFAHGAAGVAHALLELFAATGEARFRATAEEAFRYERHWFSAQQGNWPDLREYVDEPGGPGPSYALGWCHGAPGIGLSRARAFELLGDRALRDEAEVAARTTAAGFPQLAAPPYGNFSLCHGAAGNADLMLEADRVLGGAEWRTAAEEVGRRGVEKYERAGVPWAGGVTGGGESPALMLGAAGTGYFYLRLADPEATPPVTIVLPEADARSSSHARATWRRSVRMLPTASRST